MNEIQIFTGLVSVEPVVDASVFWAVMTTECVCAPAVEVVYVPSVGVPDADSEAQLS